MGKPAEGKGKKVSLLEWYSADGGHGYVFPPNETERAKLESLEMGVLHKLVLIGAEMNRDLLKLHVALAEFNAAAGEFSRTLGDQYKLPERTE